MAEKKANQRSQSRSAAKSFRQSERARLRHKSRRSMIATMEKKLRAAVAANDEAAALDLLNKQFSVLDKAVKGGTFHKNKADRKKSRLGTLVAKAAKADA